MKQIKIKTSTRGYSVYIGQNSIESIDKFYRICNYSKVGILIDSYVYKLKFTPVTSLINKYKYVFPIDILESQKSILTVQKVWSFLTKNSFDRNALLINIGGGVILDTCGFAAGTYMRGIDYLNIPTTLLAQIDAGIGGKVGINFKELKNYIGLFDNPIGVLIDTSFLETLPKREVCNGFAEILKYGIIADSRYFSFVTSKKPGHFSKRELTKIITNACLIKKKIIEKDERDKNSRKILNFGHTVGHAIEALTQHKHHPLLHGESVSIGMVAESYLAWKLNLISKTALDTIQTSLTGAGLPVSYPDLVSNKIINKIMYDKKNSWGQPRWTLPTAIGEASYDFIAPPKLIKEAVSYVTNS
jgi:3-dehydroquinate synthase